MILPERLQQGDTIGIIAPASPPNMEKVKQTIPFFEEMGLDVKLGKYIDHGYGYLAGTDAERLADFHQMIADPNIKAIIFARGGYGTGRLAAQIDYQLIQNNPKIIWGYSDITYLHIAIRQMTELVTFHGPMAESDIAKEDFAALSASMFKQLFQPSNVIYSEKISPLQVLVSGEASGQLVGGNLSLIVSTLGTPFEVNTAGKLLLLEDVDEPPYRVDSMLNQLKLAGKLANTAGVIVGDFANAKPKQTPSLTLEQVFQEYLGALHCPVMTGFKIGHCSPNFSVPLGVEATMQTTNKTLHISPGVTSCT